MECLIAGVGLMLAGRMLLVGTTAMAAAVMYRCRWEEEEGVDEEVVGEEEAALPDIVEAGVDRCGAVELAAAEAGGETAAEIPVINAAAGEAVAEIPVVGKVARES